MQTGYVRESRFEDVYLQDAPRKTAGASRTLAVQQRPGVHVGWIKRVANKIGGPACRRESPCTGGTPRTISARPILSHTIVHIAAWARLFVSSTTAAAIGSASTRNDIDHGRQTDAREYRWCFPRDDTRFHLLTPSDPFGSCTTAISHGRLP